MTPHCHRYTFVSMMQLLDIDMTRHYLHVQKPRRLDAAQQFRDAFSKTDRGVHGNILDYKTHLNSRCIQDLLYNNIGVLLLFVIYVI